MSETATPAGTRTTQQVFAHHLAAFGEGLDSLVSDYAANACICLNDQTIIGHQGIRLFFDGFLKGIRPGFWDGFKVLREECRGDVAYLVWEAPPFVRMATDTLLVRDGKIQVQTFTVLA
ncbi:MAG: nuclear transport factor 2 family protein [Burkholderiaceae bacterium]